MDGLSSHFCGVLFGVCVYHVGSHLFSIFITMGRGSDLII